MKLRQLGRTDLAIVPLVLGGNVFGWTIDRETSFRILDAFVDAGFNAIDTADWYNRSAPGLQGGESETILGEWLHDRGARDRVVLITKGGLEMGEGMEGLGRDYLARACEASLRRLRTDHIDVYMAHRADPNTAIEETLGAFRALRDAGKIGYAGCSNYTAAELDEAIAAGASTGFGYDVIEPHYNLMDRHKYEGRMESLAAKSGLGVLAYYALASGFLSGKYRSTDDLAGSSRVRMVSTYLNERGLSVLSSVDEIAARHGATNAQVALAWVMARASVTAAIASATSLAQLSDILGSVDIALSPEDLAALDECSAPPSDAG